VRGIPFASAWAFIFSAAAYDCYFAWQHRAVMPSWELNPLARWAAGQFGLAAVFGLKFVGLSFAACLAAYCRRRRRGLGRALTLSALGVYALLSLHYLVSHAQAEGPVVSPPELRGQGVPRPALPQGPGKGGQPYVAGIPYRDESAQGLERKKDRPETSSGLPHKERLLSP
jgi:hypothetical protein